MAWPLLEPSRPPALPPVLGSSSDTKSLGPLLVGIIAHIQIRIVITAATETPRGEHSHAVLAHVAEGHGHLGATASKSWQIPANQRRSYDSCAELADDRTAAVGERHGSTALITVGACAVR